MPSKPCPDGPLRGSRLQLRSYIAGRQAELNQILLTRLGVAGADYSNIDWVSPLVSSGYAEYRDSDLLRQVGLSRLEDDLREFWPENGPCWDGLAVAHNADDTKERALILVEAKSHRLEVCGSGCRATAAESKEKIELAFNATKNWLAVRRGIPWNSSLYQYANRLAYLYFFRVIANPVVEAWLINIYFTGDPYRPTSQEQWCDFLPEVKWSLGLERSPFCSIDVYLPAIAR